MVTVVVTEADDTFDGEERKTNVCARTTKRLIKPAKKTKLRGVCGLD